ncbi:G kinase-anchoring protein 1-like [Chelonus insularis]|uniref:G kinase-anchoring protein 1-like n=1 Tax=Chelonus insularis TaxID=460826 RepID=UPI00158F412F|nr:G kinase-anchoring protein 1-like [Chelonus insularis]
MATAVPSRFAVLAIDDDDDFKPKKSQKPSVNVKPTTKAKNDKSKQPTNAKKDEKKKPNKNKKKKSDDDNQGWEQWKKKDSMAVEKAYKQELHEAILLSKLTYESEVQNGVKENEVKKNQGNRKSKKSTMSLEEFNNLGASPLPHIETVIPEDNSRGADTQFFDRVEKDAKEELIKARERDILRSRFNTLDADITSAQLKVEVEKRDNEIVQLKKDIQSLKVELMHVKERNKKLCRILADGEMKEKALVLQEVAKLQEIRDELTSEVASLHIQLEQERSKTRASSADVKTSKNKKRPASENV